MTQGPTPPEDSGSEPVPPVPEQPLTPPNLSGGTPPATQQPVTPPNLGQQPAQTGMSGCAKAAIIGGAVILVVIIGVVAAAVIGFSRFAGEVEESFSEEPCQFISSEQASDVIGTDVEATSGDSALGAILGLIRDTRLLGDSPSCFISDDDSTIQIWVSVDEGSDAAGVFAAGAEVAAGQVVSSTESNSGTIIVETDPFRGEDVPDLGEEAFCVNVGATITGGVFARSDDRVVFVSALALAENEGADVLDGSLCERALPVARALLG